MSTDDPDNDPFRKPPPRDSPGQPPPGSPYGDPPPPPAPGAGGYNSPGAGDYGPGPSAGGYGGGSPYGQNPYGSATGPGDPLAGMAPLAARGKRLLARIIDALLIGIPLGIIAGLAVGFDYDDTNGTFWQGGLYTLVYFVYEGLMLSRSGQTVGKMAMNIRVAMLQDGAVPAGSPAWSRAAVYQLPTLVPCFGSIFWLINVLYCTWDQPFRQCLHDKAARTVVVVA
ncbi:RDD family protein [Streptomyces oceani]|uniref:RDD domain-containing protein n=1 Tax=Streptomyces oceani TaxID=1075402 RepID=A0A1E7KG56_9ACTN|nr:RDD family protein [Streptomyces oceani]OEV02864.1 hypothetical protein AN216_15800 [Streptomyces oceani]